MPNILCLYYSRTGTTKQIMETIAGRLGAELVEYTDGKARKGPLGYLGACVDSFKRKLPTLLPLNTRLPLSEYDAVVIAMPIWAEGCSCVGRSLLQTYGDQLPERVYFVVTHMADNDYEKPISALDRYLRRPQSGHVSVSTKQADHTERVLAFTDTLLSSL